MNDPTKPFDQAEAAAAQQPPVVGDPGDPQPPAGDLEPDPAAAAPPPAQPDPPAVPPLPGAPVQPPGSTAQATVTMPPEPGTPPEVAKPAEVPADWPQAGYEGPQPWQVENPPELTHNRGFVASGAAGELVVELAACLAHLGIGTSLSQGTNAHAIYGPTEQAAVAEFCRVYGVEEDPAIVRATGSRVVGPWIWEALFRAVRAKDAA